MGGASTIVTVDSMPAIFDQLLSSAEQTALLSSLVSVVMFGGFEARDCRDIARIRVEGKHRGASHDRETANNLGVGI